MAFLRFVIGKVDQNSRRELGVFQAFAELRRAGSLYWHEVEPAKEV
jgi:hypothetical protein